MKILVSLRYECCNRLACFMGHYQSITMVRRWIDQDSWYEDLLWSNRLEERPSAAWISETSGYNSFALSKFPLISADWKGRSHACICHRIAMISSSVSSNPHWSKRWQTFHHVLMGSFCNQHHIQVHPPNYQNCSSAFSLPTCRCQPYRHHVISQQ